MLCGSAPLLCTTLVHLGELIPAIGCLSHSGKLTQDQEKKTGWEKFHSCWGSDLNWLSKDAESTKTASLWVGQRVISLLVVTCCLVAPVM